MGTGSMPGQFKYEQRWIKRKLLGCDRTATVTLSVSFHRSSTYINSSILCTILANGRIVTLAARELQII